jgi:hypothetical protein
LQSLELGPGQKWLVAAFKPPHAFGGWGYWTSPKLNLSMWNDTVNFMVERHEILRTVFVKDGDKMEQRIYDRIDAVDIEVIDLTAERTTKESRLSLAKQLSSSRFESMRLDQWPLFKVIVLHVSPTVDECVFVGHHMCFDMISSRIMLAEMNTVYHEKVAGRPIKLRKVPNYGDFVKKLKSDKLNQQRARNTKYWVDMLTPPPTGRLPQDRHGPNLVQDLVHAGFALTREESKVLMKDRTQQYGVRPYTMLLAPLYELLAEVMDTTDVTVSHRVMGRMVGADVTHINAIGNYAVNFPLRLRDVRGNRGNMVTYVKKAYAKVPLSGVSYDAVAEDLTADIWPCERFSPVRANFLGNISQGDSGALKMLVPDTDTRCSLPGGGCWEVRTAARA